MDFLKRIFKRRYVGKRVGKEPNRFVQWWGKRRLAAKIAMIGGASVLTLALAVFITLLLWIRPPADNGIILNLPTPTAPELPSGASPAPPPSGAENAPEEGYVKREGVHTFLLAGIHEGMTDTLMVATLDTVEGTCYVLSIPRDTAIGRAPRTVKKINSAYSQQRNVWDDEPGMLQLKKEIATLIGYQPQYCAVVDYKGFVRLIDAIGGVDFDVPMRMYVPSEGIDLQKGMQPLNGNQAMQLVRFRYDHVTGLGYDDYGRIETQQKLLSVAGKKALSNWTKFPEYITIAQENLESDIDWGNLLWLAGEVRKIGMENVVFNTLPTYSVVDPKEVEYMYYEAVKAEEALAMINETINPFTVPIGEELVEYIELTER